MQESYVKYEVAELLKKQGFNEECASFYLKNDKTLRFTEKPLKDVGEAVILRRWMPVSAASSGCRSPTSPAATPCQDHALS